MRRLPMASLVPLVSAIAIALTACGGAAKSDEQAVGDTIRASLTTTNPDDCSPDATQTPVYLRQSTFGSAALQTLYEQRCRTDIKRLAARSVAVSDVSVHGTEAHATFRAQGGQYAYARATVALRKDDGRWRLNRLEALTLDRAAYDRAQLQLFSAVGAFSPSAATCASQRLAMVSDRALERALVAARPGVFADTFLICFLRPELRKGGLDLLQTRCVILRLRRAPDTLMLDIFAGTQRAQSELRQRVARTATLCRAR